MPVHEDILEWSGTRPDWQRDALRRLAGTPHLTDEDTAELVELCKAPYADVDPPPKAQAITSQDLIGITGAERREVKLIEVSEVTNVNAISSEAPLRFSPVGVTMVYGGNGSGKSGYIRLLKQVCRARGEKPAVLPDIYAPGDHGSASARLRYSVDAEEDAVAWQDGADPPDPLRAISIFDHECASVYTDERCEVAFLPAGLDLLQRLTDVMTEVRRRIDQEIEHLESRAGTLPAVPEDTRVHEVLDQLNEPGIKAVVEELATIEEGELERLDELEISLTERDPAARAKELRARAGRVGAGLERLEKLLHAVSDEAVDELRTAMEQRGAARRAVEIASAEAFSAEPVPGTGSEPWRALWESARVFWEEQSDALGDYPPVAGGQCLLCQQDLDVSAVERFERFEKFVQSDVEQRAGAAEERVEELKHRLRAVAVLSAEELTADVRLSDDETADRATQVIEVALQRRGQLLGAEAPETLDEIADLEAGPIVQDLETIVEGLRSQAAALSSAAEEEGREELLKERDALLARKRLAERQEEVFQEIDRREQLKVLHEARSDTATTGVTRRNTELTQQYLTEELTANFRETLTSLRLDHIPIHVEGAPGTRGTAYHRLRLEAEVDDVATPTRILSRGEHRAVAIAAFISEVATQQETSTIVLDDPVSSLDHDRRDVVAGKLVEIGRSRPVVVFTHDMAFTLALQKYGEALDVQLSMSRLLRQGSQSGRVAVDLPWHGMTVKQRIGHLRQLQQKAAAVQRGGDQEAYAGMIKDIYGHLREAWERAVEEVLLNMAVERFSPEIRTLRLRNIHGVSAEQMVQLEAGMTKSSRWLRGHDDAAALDDPVPPPEEIAEDIEALDQWRRDVHQLHQR